MKISNYWFRTRKEKTHYKTLISLDPKEGWSIACRCDTCGNHFNRNFKAKEFGFDICDKCSMKKLNKILFTGDIKQKISIDSSSWHAKNDNKELVSKIASDRYKNEEYAQKHKQACKERSSSEEYLIKLKQSIDPVAISCGLRKINKEDFDDFITEESSRERSRFRDLKIKDILFQKANYTCDICQERGGKLNAHHLDGWNWCLEKRFDLDNLVCLCHSCHSGFHKKYNNRDNTKQQYEEYKLFKNRK